MIDFVIVSSDLRLHVLDEERGGTVNRPPSGGETSPGCMDLRGSSPHRRAPQRQQQNVPQGEEVTPLEAVVSRNTAATTGTPLLYGGLRRS